MHGNNISDLVPMHASHAERRPKNSRSKQWP
nr:MAG TPA: hypothetical protein [Caudoviricetes sp.]